MESNGEELEGTTERNVLQMINTLFSLINTLVVVANQI